MHKMAYAVLHGRMENSMIFCPTNMKVNYMKSEYAVADTQNPIFSWGARHQIQDSRQAAYCIKVTHMNEVLWDSGFVYSSSQTAVYAGRPLPSGAIIEWRLRIKDENGNMSRETRACFKTACYDKLCGRWIASPEEKGHEVQYFQQNFSLESRPVRAALYYCGLGLSKPYINGFETDSYRLQPVHTNYAKECCYVISPLDEHLFRLGENKIEILVAGGWRKNYGEYLNNMSALRKIDFMGNMCLWAELVMYFEDGKSMVVATDESWDCSTGNIVYSHIFNGEIYDERIKDSIKNKAISSDFAPLKLVPQYIEPICVKKEIKPINEYDINGLRVYDFGENIAGVSRLKVDGNCKGAEFIIRHAEDISQTGELFTDTLRSAKATDIYICDDGERNFVYVPEFTYHGFRYATLEVKGEFDGSIELSAFVLYTDIDTDGYFRCGDQTVNEIYKTILRTERGNIHSIATDCPQRDERMAWMNDATVRFMSMPYHFNTPRLFEKIIQDIANEQDDMGRLTCTAPFVYGERPADPVCSAYLVAAYENYLLTGNANEIKKHYAGFEAWNDFLNSQAPDGIVNYSYYGDWAGPEDCCYTVGTIGNSDVRKTEEYDTGAANSLYIPGEMISTAFYCMNLSLMVKFAELVGKNNHKYIIEKKRVRGAFLNKWFDETMAMVGNGTQGEQALALFAKLIPKEYEQKAAKHMADSVIADGYRLKTGNLVTPMLMEMLSKYGYQDIAWKLLTRKEYPSWGYMLANGATTVWERFELKKECGMNSHNHPMYGAVSGWLFRSLAGFRVIKPSELFELAPNIPTELLYFEMRIPVLYGSIYLKCEKKYGKLTAMVDVPFGTNVILKFADKEYKLKHGFSTITT